MELVKKQAQDIENLRATLAELNSKYMESEKALGELRAEWHKLLLSRAETPSRGPSPVDDRDKLEREVKEKLDREREAKEKSEKEAKEKSEKEKEELKKNMVDGFERRVTALQDDLERKFRTSEDSWKGRLSVFDEDNKRVIRELQDELKRKAQDTEKVHKAEKLRLQMTIEEQEKRIREMESQLKTQRKTAPVTTVQQVKVRRKNMTPRLTTAVDNFPSMINDLKQELSEALDIKLEEYGIQKGATCVSDRDRDAIFNKLRNEHNHLQNKIAKYGAARSTIENHIRDRAPNEYSSQELLDEASKIRVRTRTGRQVTGDTNNQRITEITTYDITPVRSSDIAANRGADTSKKVTFVEGGGFPTKSSSPTRSGETGASETCNICPDLNRPPDSENQSAKTQEDERWFTDED